MKENFSAFTDQVFRHQTRKILIKRMRIQKLCMWLLLRFAYFAALFIVSHLLQHIGGYEGRRHGRSGKQGWLNRVGFMKLVGMMYNSVVKSTTKCRDTHYMYNTFIRLKYARCSIIWVNVSLESVFVIDPYLRIIFSFINVKDNSISAIPMQSLKRYDKAI